MSWRRPARPPLATLPAAALVHALGPSVDAGGVVLLDHGAASALYWAATLHRVGDDDDGDGNRHAGESAAGFGSATPTTQGTGYSAAGLHRLLSRCSDLNDWRAVIRQRVMDCDRRRRARLELTVVVTEFLWDREKLLSDIVTCLLYTSDAADE